MKDEELFSPPQSETVEEAAVPVPILDYAASPTLTTLRETIGEKLTIKLVMAKGGTDVYLPERVTEQSALSRIIGAEAASELVKVFGNHRHLEVPTGKGLSHGRRIDPVHVIKLGRLGLSVDMIARRLSCTARQVRNIAAKIRSKQKSSQLDLFSKEN